MPACQAEALAKAAAQIFFLTVKNSVKGLVVFPVAKSGRWK
jgi:hypothetical protein